MTQRILLILSLLAVATMLAAGCSKKVKLAQPGITVNDFPKARKHFEAAAAKQADGEFIEAAKLYKEATLAAPDFAQAWNNLGVVLMQAGYNMEAARAFQEAAVLIPDDASPYYNIGTIWHKINYPDDAQRYYKLALDRQQRYLPALRQTIRLDHELGTGDDATLGRIRIALQLERDPEWIALFMRERQRIKERAVEATQDYDDI